MSTPAEHTGADIRKMVKRRRWLGWFVFVCVGGFVYYFMGLYTVQPIGALPDGATVLIWRSQRQPFFDSPDAACLRLQGGVSLFCRAMALGAMKDEIAHKIVVLPYQGWAYALSTGGQDFDR